MSLLEEKVLELIERIYNCKYTRSLLVKIEDGRYTLILFVHNPQFGGIVISNLCNSDDEFLKYIEKELKDRKLTKSQQYTLKLYGNNEC